MAAYSSQRRGMSPVTLLAIFLMLLVLGISSGPLAGWQRPV